MMTAAREALVPLGKEEPRLRAVTVVTSMEASDGAESGVTLSTGEDEERLAGRTQKWGMEWGGGWCA
ncbi:orotidine-5'-phosphate decarboxylase [Escherichia coli]|nr:orotidine-5'-phosphate decarboxylase [Escherichia coli]